MAISTTTPASGKTVVKSTARKRRESRLAFWFLLPTVLGTCPPFWASVCSPWCQ